MSGFVISVAFLLAAGQPPADAPAQQPAAGPSEPAKAEPKMICKYEHATGSRVQKTKVCRPEGQSGEEQDTKLQRELSKNGDFVDPQKGGFGN
ncbi:MAG: hypothetical protein QM773_19165 [Hyphomonadaceae bacterium]